MSLRDKPMTIPNLERFGFYLCPLVFQNKFGFKRAQTLLFLDTNGTIDAKGKAVLSEKLGFVELQSYGHATLFAINPVNNEYPVATKILQLLKLGYEVSSKRSTIKEVESEFKSRCFDAGVDLDILTKVTDYASNLEKFRVQETSFGRFGISEDGVSRRDLEDHQLLYALNDKGVPNFDSVAYCVKSFFLEMEELAKKTQNFSYKSKDLVKLSQIIFQSRPRQIQAELSFDVVNFTEDMQERKRKALSHYETLIKAIDFVEADMVYDISATRFEESKDPDDLEAKRHEKIDHLVKISYSRDIAESRDYSTDIPATVIAILMEMVLFEDEGHCFVPNVGSINTLAALLPYIEEENIRLTLAEQYQDNSSTFNSYINYRGSDNVDIANTHVVENPPEHNVTFAICPKETLLISEKIPESSVVITEKSHQIILNALSKRKRFGRSIFVTSVDDPNHVGTLSEESAALIGYLYKNYTKVFVVDLPSLFLSNKPYKFPLRLFVIGSKAEEANDSSPIYVDFLQKPVLKILETPEELFVLATNFNKFLKSEEISNKPLMDIFSAAFDLEEEESGEQQQMEIDLDSEGDADKDGFDDAEKQVSNNSDSSLDSPARQEESSEESIDSDSSDPQDSKESEDSPAHNEQADSDEQVGSDTDNEQQSDKVSSSDNDGSEEAEEAEEAEESSGSSGVKPDYTPSVTKTHEDTEEANNPANNLTEAEQQNTDEGFYDDKETNDPSLLNSGIYEDGYSMEAISQSQDSEDSEEDAKNEGFEFLEPDDGFSEPKDHYSDYTSPSSR